MIEYYENYFIHLLLIDIISDDKIINHQKIKEMSTDRSVSYFQISKTLMFEEFHILLTNKMPSILSL